MASAPQFPAAISQDIWNLKYRLRSAGRDDTQDATLDDTFWRVAHAVAAVETGGKKARKARAQDFHDAIADFGFLPAGRILAGAGTGRAVTLFNCFVMGRIDDDLGSIFDNVKEAALTMQQGGGIGHDFSTLRPKGALVKSIGADASGPVSFMDVWDAMCRTIMSAGARRGAMMATLRCDHPDIEDFIGAKADASRLRNFNLSVLVTDAFMAAVKTGAPWPLQFDGKVYRTVDARALWDQIMRATYEFAEPGVIFIDRINMRNNLGYCEIIQATNPCGEQPLPPYGACLLGSINLTRFVTKPFTQDARLDLAALEARVRTAVRFLDNVIDVSGYPLPAQRHEAKAKRRIGLGMTGLADALIMLGVRYGSDDAQRLAGTWMAAIETAAYLASADLAAERGSFPLFDRDKLLARPHIAGLRKDIRKAIFKNGLRNGCITSIAPTGTISMFAGNVSSGIEPVFAYVADRRILSEDGSSRSETVEDYAHALYRRTFGADAALTPAFVTAGELTPHDHLVMQSAVQAHVDSSISKTINCAVDIPFDAFKTIYSEAYDRGLKGCTTYRPNTVTGAVLTPAAEVAASETVAATGVRPPNEEPRLHVPQPPVSPGERDHLRHPAAGTSRRADIVYMSKPLAREPVLSGYTYKLKWPESDHAIYVTINDIEADQGHPGTTPRSRPFEIFINTRNLEHYAWTVALTRMISAVFRRGGDVAFVAEELKAVFDPQGGRWMDGRYVPSLLAAIGEIIEAHMIRTGFLAAPLDLAGSSTPAADLPDLGKSEMAPLKRRAAGGRSCPRCHSLSFVKLDGCWVCETCGFSRCG
jgi:ribonucleoside-diphosphate reductase alpha chain